MASAPRPAPSFWQKLQAPAVLLAGYTLACTFSLFFANLLRFDFVIPEQFAQRMGPNLCFLLPLKLSLLAWAGQVKALLPFFRLPDLYRIAGIMFGVGALTWSAWALQPDFFPPRSVIIGDALLSFVGVAGLRTGLRIWFERQMRVTPFSEGVAVRHHRVIIVGAGDTGTTIAADFLARPHLGKRPIGYLDDDTSKWGRRIHGLPVLGPPEFLEELTGKTEVDGVIIAMAHRAHRRVQEVLRIAQEHRLTAQIIPSFVELTSGRAKVTSLRPIDIIDVLGREPVSIDTHGIQKMLSQEVVMVTGAAGSIGQELCEQILQHGAQRLILLDHSESQLFPLEMRLRKRTHANQLKAIVADVADRVVIDTILEREKPTLIVHAAAYKHVPMMERQPAEAIRNNTFGTRVLADLALKHAVPRFIFVSTDKAIRPTSIMGASKRLAELYLQALGRMPDTPTAFTAVRFGNVLGSSGSVITIFRQQIAEGGPVTVTHPEVTRYFMTVEEAVGLVLQCGLLGARGEVLMLEMGTPVKIAELAKQMIELSGLRPGEDVEIVYTGLRPGEKLFEELRYDEESFQATTHPHIHRLQGKPPALPELAKGLDDLAVNLTNLEPQEVQGAVQRLMPEYQPNPGESPPAPS